MWEAIQLFSFISCLLFSLPVFQLASLSCMEASQRVIERRCSCIQNMTVYCAAQSIFLCPGSRMEHPSRVALSKPVRWPINAVQHAWNKRWNCQTLAPPGQIQAQAPKLGLCPCPSLPSGQGKEWCNSSGKRSPFIKFRPTSIIQK